jgi:hypothetical protein
MKIYKTNSALGYQQFAYLLKISDTEYLCIDLKNVGSSLSYEVGEIVEDIEEYEIEEVVYDIKTSPLYNKLTEYIWEKIVI